MSICDNDIILFHQACREIINRERASMGIGTLSEKTVHAVLKRFYEPDPEHQEIPVENFVADILRDGEIIEIQTRGFNKLRRKLDTFLKYYPVTIVYPIIHTKWLYWINEETGELSPKRKSPKIGTFYDAVPELYKIKMYLDNPNLHLCLVLIDADEYRLLNGWSRDRKKGSSRFDRIPVADARRLMGPDKIVGATTKTVPQALEAYEQGADYLGVGAIYPTTTKVKTILTSTDTLREICEAVPIAVNAIGGLNKDNIDVLEGIPIAGICVVSAIMKAADPRQAAQQLKARAMELKLCAKQ